MSDFPYIGPTHPRIDQPKPPSFARRLLRAFVSLLQTVAFAAVLFVVVNLVTARIRVEGNSMEPSLHNGQFVVVNRLAYFLDPPERGDIVVFPFPLNEQRRFIKRVIGLPGDVVQVQDGHVYVNGDLINEPYLSNPPAFSGEWQVGFDEVFVLGDNRNNSQDSTDWGPLAIETIIGKAILVYWPLDNLGWIPHYDLATAAESSQ